VRRLAVESGKLASDLRLLAMGPRAGLGEVRLPAVQPGSSIMPGKVNPSIPEMVNQVCFQVVGCDATIAAACEAGQLELNVMMPVIAWNAIHATRILGSAMHVLQRRSVAGIEADEERTDPEIEQVAADERSAANAIFSFKAEHCHRSFLRVRKSAPFFSFAW